MKNVLQEISDISQRASSEQKKILIINQRLEFHVALWPYQLQFILPVYQTPFVKHHLFTSF